MTYQIISFRWLCPECSSAVRLYFVPEEAQVEDGPDEYICKVALCVDGHSLPEDLMSEILDLSDQEFYSAMRNGSKVGEIWSAPVDDSSSNPEQFERTI